MLLAIDTSTRSGGVALWENGAAVASLTWRSKFHHSEELMPAISSLLSSRRLTMRDLQGIGVALGPGGFSALRVGLSTAKGLAMPIGLPLVGVGTLEAEAHPWRSVGMAVQPILDLGRGNLATARFAMEGNAWQKVADEHIATPEELLASLQGAGPTILCGEGVPSYNDALKDGLPAGSMLMPFTTTASRLSALGEMAEAKLSEEEIPSMAGLEPLYLRPPNIGPPKTLKRIQL